MSEARTQILAAIGRARAAGVAAGLNPDARNAFIRPRASLVPAVDDATVQGFIDRAQALSITFDRVASLAEVPDAVLAYIAAHSLPLRAVLATPLAALPWPAQLALRTGPARQDDVLSVTPCLAAIAETGSVVLTSSAGSPTTLNFVPDHHVAVLLRSQVVRTQEEVWTLLRAVPLPRAVNTISGPSRTADVEQVLQLGVHGPRRMHVVLVDDASGAAGVGGSAASAAV